MLLLRCIFYYSFFLCFRLINTFQLSFSVCVRAYAFASVCVYIYSRFALMSVQALFLFIQNNTQKVKQFFSHCCCFSRGVIFLAGSKTKTMLDSNIVAEIDRERECECAGPNTHLRIVFGFWTLKENLLISFGILGHGIGYS